MSCFLSSYKYNYGLNVSSDLSPLYKLTLGYTYKVSDDVLSVNIKTYYNINLTTLHIKYLSNLTNLLNHLIVSQNFGHHRNHKKHLRAYVT